MLCAVFDHGVGVERGTRFEDDVRLADLAEPCVGYPDDGDIGHTVEAHQHLFDLGGVHVESAADVHVLEPVGDGQVSACVELADVTGVQPAVVVDGLGGGLRIVEVTLHHVGAAQQHFSLVAGLLGSVDAQFVTEHGPPTCGGDGDGVIIGAADGGEALGLGEAVRGEYQIEVQLGLHTLDQHHRHHRRTCHGVPQRGQVVVLACGMVEEHLEDGGCAGKHGDLVLLNCGHCLFGIECQLWHERGTGLQTRENAGLVAEVVKERVDAQITIVFGELAVGGPGQRSRQRLAVHAQHALAATGGAGGEEDVADVFGTHGGLACVDVPVADAIPVRDERVPAGVVAVLHCDSHDVSQIGQRRGVELLDAVGTEELSDGYQHPSVAALQDVGRLVHGVPGVHGDDGGPGVLPTQAGDGPMP
ncbi:Uncharacterised protein [Mycobacteroides abscessus subsp. abscessus]|nr:Uncharacterised protein [Mycobacteroides abscessus subsp. abscessus]